MLITDKELIDCIGTCNHIYICLTMDYRDIHSSLGDVGPVVIIIDKRHSHMLITDEELVLIEGIGTCDYSYR